VRTATSFAEALEHPGGLTTLDLSQSPTETLSERVRELRDLHTIVLDNTRATELPHALWSVEGLRTLSLRNSNLGLVGDLGGLEQLHRLDLSGTLLPLSSEGVANFLYYLGKLKQLQELVLDHMGIEVLQPAALSPLTSLRLLSLRNNLLFSFALQDGELGALEQLDLTGNEVTSVAGGNVRSGLVILGLRAFPPEPQSAPAAASEAPATTPTTRLVLDDNFEKLSEALETAPEGSVELVGTQLTRESAHRLGPFLSRHGKAVGGLALDLSQPKETPSYEHNLRGLDFGAMPNLVDVRLTHCEIGTAIFEHPKVSTLSLKECRVRGVNQVHLGVDSPSSLRDLQCDEVNFYSVGAPLRKIADAPRVLQLGPGSQLQVLRLSLDQDYAESFFTEIVVAGAPALREISVAAEAVFKVTLQGSLPALENMALSAGSYGSYEVENLSGKKL